MVWDRGVMVSDADFCGRSRPLSRQGYAREVVWADSESRVRGDGYGLEEPVQGSYMLEA